MPKHFSQVFVESDGEKVTVTIRCQHCEGGTFTIATAHLETLARILPKVAREAGYDLNEAKTETFVFKADTPETRAAAERLFDDFVARRKAKDN